jgi:folate-dependent phosphoribosylglycinamide formyltransferase PurN
MKQTKKIVLLCGKGESSTLIYNGLKNEIDFAGVIIENAPRKKNIIKRRINKIGWIATLGQVLFILIVPKILLLFSSKKKKIIFDRFNLDSSPIDPQKEIFIESVNSDNCIALLNELKPDLILVNGTRIISSKVLDSVSARFINSHVGITPKYRGVHGGYWAIANDDAQNFGVTIHEIDTGIDTGDVLYQKTLTCSSNDNFITYPLIQTAGAIELLLIAMEEFNKDLLNPIKSVSTKSKLWYHPTLWNYLYLRLIKGIK